MRAAVVYERKAPMVVDEIEINPPEAGDVQVRVRACGVCHSDYHHWERDLGTWLPAVLGHEVAGIVESVGAGVTRVRPGDHVVLAFGHKCGECYFCLHGLPNLCTPAPDAPTLARLPRLHKGDTKINSYLNVAGFAEQVVVPANNVFPIPPTMPFDAAALIGCGVATGFGSVVNVAKVEPGASVVVIGCGGVGLNVIQAAHLAGAARIIAVDIRDNKLEYAVAFGATHTINGSRENVIERVRALTGGLGADFAFEVIGHPATVEQAYESVRKGGTAVVVGVATAEATVSISPLAMMRTSRTLVGTAYGNVRPAVDFPRIIDLAEAGQLKLGQLISRRFALDEVNEAFRAMSAGEVARGVVVFE